jgi:hypothetical protein
LSIKGFSFDVTPSRTVGPVEHHLETRLLASIFDTLLSSQGSDAHHLLAFRPVSGATLQNYSLRSWASNPVAPCRKRWIERAWLSARCPTVAVSRPASNSPSRAPGACWRTSCVRWVSALGPACFAGTAVVSVPPCRADVENSRRTSPRNTNPQVSGLQARASPRSRRHRVSPRAGRRRATCGRDAAAPPRRGGSPPR